MRCISIDIESYSDVDLSKCGVYRYSSSPNFEILLFGYSVDGGEVKVVDVACGEEIPAEILAALSDESVTKWAFNAMFERVCLSNYLGEWQWERFKAYNFRDVEAEMQIQQRLAKFPVPDFVWEEYWQDQEINDRGIGVDMEMVRNAIAIPVKTK